MKEAIALEIECLQLFKCDDSIIKKLAKKFTGRDLFDTLLNYEEQLHIMMIESEDKFLVKLIR